MPHIHRPHIHRESPLALASLFFCFLLIPPEILAAEGPHLWATGEAGLSVFDLGSEEAVPRSLDEENRKEAVLAASGHRMSVRSRDALEVFAVEDGIRLSSKISLPPLGKEAGRRGELVEVAADHSHWIAEGRVVTAFGLGGQELHRIVLDREAAAMELDSGRERLWVATESELLALHPIDGRELHREPAPKGLRLLSLAVDPGSGRLFAGHSAGLIEYQADEGSPSDRWHSRLELDLPLRHLETASAEGELLGLWVATDLQVSFLPEADPARVLTWAVPFSGDATLRALAIDPAGGRAWVSDGRKIMSIDAEGSVRPWHDFGAGADISSLAFQARVEGEEPVATGDDDVADGREEADERTSPRRAVAEKVGGVGGEPVYTPVASPRGLRPNTPFAVSDIDHVDASSGNLTLRIPFGQEYKVGPFLSYQIQAVYNSNVWEHHLAFCELNPDNCISTEKDRTFAFTNPASNAGLGWEVHFGRLFAPAPPPGLPIDQQMSWPNRKGFSAQGINWLYIAPDGAAHYLEPLPGRDNGTNQQPIRYSKDGSRLRMRQISANEIRVEMPNGVYSTFEKTNSANGTTFCNNTTVTDCWRFKSSSDHYGNKVWVTYSYSPASKIETWRVADSTGRGHDLLFTRNPDLTGSSDCPVPGGAFCTPSGDEWGDLRRLLTQVKLAAFDGTTSTYTLQSSVDRVVRGCPHDEMFPLTTANISIPFLNAIQPPKGQAYVFEYNKREGNRCNSRSGTMAQVTLPTGGGYRYEWTNAWPEPTRCTYRHSDEAEFEMYRTGIRRRIELTRSSACTGEPGDTPDCEPRTTSYQSQLLPALYDENLSGPNCRRADYRITTIDGPVNGDGNRVRTRSYLAVHAGERLPTESGKSYDEWQVTDSGLPYAKGDAFEEDSEDGGKLFLSKETFLCNTDEDHRPTDCTKARSAYVRYLSEYRQCNKAGGDGADCFKIDAELLRRKTLYHDDLVLGEPRFIETIHAQPDGGGNFRKVKTWDNFAGESAKTRVRTTDWTVTDETLGIHATTGYLTGPDASTYLPAPSDPWILRTYGEKKTWEKSSGRTYTTSFEFDGGGALLCSRRQKLSGQKNAGDLVVELQLGSIAGTNAGLPVKEIVASGSVPTTEVCAGNGGNAVAGTRFELDHSYEYSSLSKTELAGYPTWYRADIDKNTGRAKATYNPQGQKTNHTFDVLGRLTGSSPEASLEEAALSIAYHNSSHDVAYVVEKRQKAGVTYDWKKTNYDGFGRVLSELRERPTNAGGLARSKRITAWDTAGHRRKVSTWQDNAAFNRNLATLYQDVDAFGRARKIVLPDHVEGVSDRVIKKEFFGNRLERTKADVYTGQGTSGMTEGWQTVEKDAFGRPVRNQLLHATLMKYDPYGKLIESKRQEGEVIQKRLFGYDARGWLLSESHPEYAGIPVLYTRDAFAQVRTKTQGTATPRILTYSYDGGARLVEISDDQGRVWEEWEWGLSNDVNDYRKGKVVSATRHNYPFNNTNDFPVTETYTYGGKLGLIDTKITSVAGPEGPVTFTQSFEHDPQGQRTQESFPLFCVSSSQDPCSQTSGLTHSVTRTYARGFVTRVTSNRSPWAAYSYHGNLQPAGTSYSNGVTGAVEQGTNGISRPNRISFSSAGSQARDLYDSGQFLYDERSNIYGMGDDVYHYDTANRLVYASFEAAGARLASYSYDAFDNLESAFQDDAGHQDYALEKATNRYLGGNDDIEYDDWGNLIKIGPPNFTMRYDHMNMQVHFKDYQYPNGPDDPITTVDHLYAYGPGNKRLLTHDVLTGVTTYRLRNLEDRVVREFEGAGTPSNPSFTHTKDLVHGHDGLIATSDATGSKKFFHKDHLGTPRAVTNQFGTRIAKYDFYPFGREIWNGEQHQENTVKFTGHQRDEHGVTDYMLGRTYAYPLRRFTSVDPARDGWNLYAYVGNNPINAFDPTGLSEEEVDACEASGDEVSCTDEIEVVEEPYEGRLSQEDRILIALGLGEGGDCSDFMCQVLMGAGQADDNPILQTIQQAPMVAGTVLGAVPSGALFSQGLSTGLRTMVVGRGQNFSAWRGAGNWVESQVVQAGVCAGLACTAAAGGAGAARFVGPGGPFTQLEAATLGLGRSLAPATPMVPAIVDALINE